MVSSRPSSSGQVSAREESHPVIRTLRPPGGWQWINVRELWRYRELAYFLCWRDVAVRYKQTALGAAWAILQPALMMAIFTLVFAQMPGTPGGDLPYPLFVYAGLLPWTFFATAINSSGNSVVGSERLITKVYFPRLLVPVAAVGAAVVDFVVAFGLLLLMMTYYRIVPGPGVLLLPVIFGAIATTAMGVGILLSALNVSYRDFRHVLPFLVQIWMFATPSVYMEMTEPAMAPHGPPGVARTAAPTDQPPVGDTRRHWFGSIGREVLAWNPLTGLIMAFRASILGGPIPWTRLLISMGIAALSLVVGCLYFRRVEGRFADII